VFRKHWREPRFWIWWWERNLSRESRLGLAAVLSVVLLAAGWTTAARLTSANASSVDDPSVWATTVARTITVHAKRASVTPTRVVTRQVVRYKPSTSVETLVRTNVVTAERVVTRTAAVTRTIVDTHTVTRSQPRTVIRRLTETAPPVTVTAPPLTVTETVPETVIVTVTVKGKRHGD